MTTTRDPAAPSTWRRAAIGILLALQTVALLVVAMAQDPATRPVRAALGGGPRQTVSQVDVRLALVVVVALLALALFTRPRFSSWLDPLLTTPIAVFAVAELNGVEDVGALVGIYALASAGVLFSAVQARVEILPGHPRLPLCFAAAVGIVPWGIVAFHQVGAGLVGRPFAGVVVAVTLVALVVALAEFVATWRQADQAALGIRIAGLSVVAWLVVAVV
jgi:hypothetical protein